MAYLQLIGAFATTSPFAQRELSTPQYQGLQGGANDRFFDPTLEKKIDKKYLL